MLSIAFKIFVINVRIIKSTNNCISISFHDQCVNFQITLIIILLKKLDQLLA